MIRADLHLHSNHSDGVLSVEEIVEWARKKRVSVISITDHDTIEGVNEGIAYGEKHQIEVIPGIEFSTVHKGEEVHILGYFIDQNSALLHSVLSKIKRQRVERIGKMIEQLNAIHLNVSLNDIHEYAMGDSIGRPHVARALVKKGYVSSIKEAFDKYLAQGKPGFVKRYQLDAKYTIHLIKELGGIAIIAHPGFLKEYSVIKDLVEYGADGLEVFHYKHDSQTIGNLIAICKSRNLLVTGGSDFHECLGNEQPIIGDITIPEQYLMDFLNYL